MRLRLVCLITLALLGASSVDAAPEGFDVDLVARLEFPTQLAFDPSGELLFVGERPGRIRLIRDGELLDRPFATIETSDAGEGGLLGLAVHPRFNDGERWIYAFHSSADGSTDMVTRIRADGTRGGERQPVIRGIPAASIHHGGVIAFGPDGKLYVANGDHAEASSAQDPEVFGGKVYRVNPDGSIPDDNPFEGSRTFSYGHRNMFGIAFDAAGELWVSENGDNDHDEINHVSRGGNYGWPEVEGPSDRSKFVDPVVDYEQIVVPTGISFATDVFGDRYEGDLFLGTYGQSTIRRIALEGDAVRRDTTFHTGEPIVALLFGPDGLYYSTPDAVKRIRARGAQQSPSASPTEPTPTLSPQTAADDEQDSPALLIWSLIAAAFATGGVFIWRDARKKKAAR